MQPSLEFKDLLAFNRDYLQLAADLNKLRAMSDDLAAMFARYESVRDRYAEFGVAMVTQPWTAAQMQQLHADYPEGVHSVVSEDGVWHVLGDVRAQFVRILQQAAQCID